MQGITTLTIALEAAGPLKTPRGQLASIGPFLQGAMIERVDASYAADLHQSAFNPYSLYCMPGDNDATVIWRINALTDTTAEHIIKPMLGMSTLSVRSIDTEFTVKSASMERLEFRELTELIHNDTATRTAIRFITPTAFKSSGSYVFMPTLKLILQNLFMHYSQIYEGDKEVDQDTIEYLDRQTAITAYNLRSQYFAHVAGGGRKIPAFTGSLSINARGPQALTGLVRMLLKFGEYAGVGIKTSMGMGGMLCTEVHGRPAQPEAEKR